MRPFCIHKLNKMPVHLWRLHLSRDAQKLKRKPDQLLETLPCQVHSALPMATVRSLLQSDCIFNKIVYHSAGGRKWFSFPFSNKIKETARTLDFNYTQLPYQFPFSSLVKHPQITHKSLWPVSDQGNWWVSDIPLRSHHFKLESSLQVWCLSFYLPSTTRGSFTYSLHGEIHINAQNEVQSSSHACLEKCVRPMKSRVKAAICVFRLDYWTTAEPKRRQSVPWMSSLRSSRPRGEPRCTTAASMGTQLLPKGLRLHAHFSLHCYKQCR